jgi:hypothetical protein
MVAIAIIAGALFVLFIILYSGLAWGFVMYKFYYWFVIPSIVVAPELTYIQCIGIYLFARIFTHQGPTRALKEEYLKDSNFEAVINGFLYPWVALFVGWVFLIII